MIPVHRSKTSCPPGVGFVDFYEAEEFKKNIADHIFELLWLLRVKKLNTGPFF